MVTFGSPASTASTGTNGTPKSIAPHDCKIPQPGTDGISSLNWSPTANLLCSSNWDSGVRVWEVHVQANPGGICPGLVSARPKAMVYHDNNNHDHDTTNKSPALDACFSADGATVFSGGADKAVRMWKLGATTPPAATANATANPNGVSSGSSVHQQIGVHDAPVSSVGYLKASNLVVSGGWDSKLKFWDTRSPTPAGESQLPGKVYAMDVKGNLMVVATGSANRQLIIYDVSGPMPREHGRKESPLKEQTRCVRCFPDQTGFAVGSLGGRVAINYLQKAGFTFQCHRNKNDVYSVNCLAFHSGYGTFATAGSDGVVTFWDKDHRQRLAAFPPIGQTIPCADFSNDAKGNLFAYASSYDWSKGSAGYTPHQTPNEIYVHYTTDDEIKPKPSKEVKGRGRGGSA